MQRRLTAWLAIFALVASAMLPAHAVAQTAGMSDFCSATPQKTTPPAHAHDATCDACFGCGGAAPAPASEAAVTVASASLRPTTPSVRPAPHAAVLIVLARGPPAVTSSPT